MADTPARSRASRLQIPRSRGAASGLLVMALGLWGALVPFIGPYFDFAFSPDQPWTWTSGRGWLQLLPGAVATLGGLLMVVSGNRATAVFGTWLAVAAGAWFVVARALAGPLGLGDAGAPVADTEPERAWLELTYFSGLGALIVFLGALALGRLSVRSTRDIAYVERHTDIVGPRPLADSPWDGEDAVTEAHAVMPDSRPHRRRSLLRRFRRSSDEKMTV